MEYAKYRIGYQGFDSSGGFSRKLLAGNFIVLLIVNVLLLGLSYRENEQIDMKVMSLP